MKKRFVITLSIIAFLLVGGIVSFILLKSKNYDVTLKSSDSLTTLTIEKIAASKPLDWEHAYGYKGFELGGEFDTLDKALHSEYFAFTIDKGENVGKRYGEIMVFCKDGHFFAMTIDKEKNSARLIEIITTIVANDAVFGQNSYEFAFPFIYHKSNNQYMCFELGEKELTVAWRDTLGLHSFDDLKSFYTYLNAESYMIDEENHAVLVKFYDTYNDVWTEKYMMQVQATETGLKVTPTQDFLDYLADEDRESSWFHKNDPLW